MICNMQPDYENDLFCIEKKHKDGFYYEVRSRNIVSGRFYGIRFEGKKKFYFFVFDSGRWNVYLFRSDAVYHPASFRDVHDLTNLETDILNKKIVPIIHIKSGKSGSCFLRRGGKIELPEMPFFYPSELRMLDRQTEIERYKYTDAPKYLITARLNKYVKPQSPQSINKYRQVAPSRLRIRIRICVPLQCVKPRISLISFRSSIACALFSSENICFHLSACIISLPLL